MSIAEIAHNPNQGEENLKPKFDALKKAYEKFSVPGQQVNVEAQQLNEQGDMTFTVSFPLSEQADIVDLLSAAGLSNEGAANLNQVRNKGEGFVTITKTEAGENSQHKDQPKLKNEIKLLVKNEDSKERNGDPAKYKVNTITAYAGEQLGIPSEQNPNSFRPLVMETGLQNLDPAQLKVIKTAGVSYNSYSSY